MLIDANVFLEVLLDQSESDACEAFLRTVQRGEREAVVTAYHVDAVAYVIGEATGTNEIATFLGSLFVYDGLSVLNQPLVDKLRACRVMDEEGVDFDDALAVRAARTEADSRIVTLDSDFADVADLETFHPADL